MRRENTFKIDYSNFPLKPSYEKIHAFCRTVLGLKREEVSRLQCHRGGACAFVKVNDLALAQKVVDEHDEKHEVESEGKKYKLRITLEDGSVEVKVYDLPEDVSEAKIVQFLSAYGDVLSIRELTWGESYDFGGVPLGIWSARMVMRRNIDSWVTIDGEQAYVVYKGQLQSCRHCHEQAHAGISCIQNKKLLVQKSYANVTKQVPLRQQLKKQAGAKPQPSTTKPVEPPLVVPPLTSSEDFPAIAIAANQNDNSGSETLTTTQTTAVVSQSLDAEQHRSSTSTTSPLKPSPIATLPIPTAMDFFKIPENVLRMHHRSNGNETDESSASSSSRRSRRVKKFRVGPEDGTEKAGGDRQ